jgi:hypothetical protein
MSEDHHAAAGAEKEIFFAALDQPNAEARAAFHRLPDGERVVLDLSGLGQDLLELVLTPPHDTTAVIEDHQPARRRALVDRAYVVGHLCSFSGVSYGAAARQFSTPGPCS